MFFVSIILFGIRFPILFKNLKKIKNKNIKSNFFDIFLQSYIYVPYFLNLLNRTNPNLIIVSNDHSVDNRSLRLAAEILDVKTVYMQHATVTKSFPPLEYDYAFLDSKFSLKTYINSYNSHKVFFNKIKKNISECKIFLTGLNKNFILKKKNLQPNSFGIALSFLDDQDSVIYLLEKTKFLSMDCIIRLHPAQKKSEFPKIISYVKKNKWLTFSDPTREALSDYLSKIRFLFASNSSIHLDANIYGIKTFSYNLNQKINVNDYYGFIKKGLTKKLNKNFDPKKILRFFIKEKKINEKGIIKKKKYFSETYNTVWQNKETKLIANIIDCILKSNSMEKFFYKKKSNVFKEVWFLRE